MKFKVLICRCCGCYSFIYYDKIFVNLIKEKFKKNVVMGIEFMVLVKRFFIVLILVREGMFSGENSIFIIIM